MSSRRNRLVQPRRPGQTRLCLYAGRRFNCGRKQPTIGRAGRLANNTAVGNIEHARRRVSFDLLPRRRPPARVVRLRLLTLASKARPCGAASHPQLTICPLTAGEARMPLASRPTSESRLTPRREVAENDVGERRS